MDLTHYIRDIPDFPKPGVLFKDITPLRADPDAFADQKLDAVAAAEARGFLFGTPLALALNVGFVPIRKPGKLPYATIAMEYQLEYGHDRLEVHSDALKPGARVLLLDDVLATGGTMRACCDLLQQAGVEVAACAFVLELDFLKGRERLAPFEVFSLVRYP